MLYTYKFRLYPNKKQKEYFSKCFGCTRFLWNQMLGEKQDYYKKTGKLLYKKISDYKKSYDFLKEVDSMALALVKLNLERAYRDFFSGKFSFPKFKSKKNSRDSFTTCNQGNNIRIVGSYINLPKIKLVKINLHRSLEGTIRRVTISRTKDYKEYYISILVDTEKDFVSLVP